MGDCPLGEVPDAHRRLEEIHRMLRPGGLLAIAETGRDGDFIRLADLWARWSNPTASPAAAAAGMAWQYVACFTRGASTAQAEQNRAA